jgi:hypothetical protein
VFGPVANITPVVESSAKAESSAAASAIDTMMLQASPLLVAMAITA